MSRDGVLRDTHVARHVGNDAENLIRAWVSHTGAVPASIQSLIDVDRFLDAAIELARCVIGEPPLTGWKSRFTSAGGPYQVDLMSGTSVQSVRGTGTSDEALSAAFLNAIANWR